MSSYLFKKNETAGIDFGTTNSLIAVMKNGNIKIIPDKNGNELLPSVVNYNENKIEVGIIAKKKIEVDPLNTIFSIKRLIGKSKKEILKKYPNLPYKITKNKKNIPLICTKMGNFTPIEISSEIIKSLISRSKKKINKVVITVPAYFDEIQRKQIKEAAKLAGLDVLRLLNEPTAAAIAYGLNTKKEEIIAIYDLGGGTFDISILKLKKGIFQVLSTGGDSNLGGDDFDSLILDWIYKKMNIKKKNNIHLQRKILNKSIKAKIQLTYDKETKIKINNKKINFHRKELNNLIKPLIKQTILTTIKTIQDASIDIKKISKVIMVGGSTRIPLVFKIVKNFFKKNPLISINPETVVAIGAATQANILIKNKKIKKFLLLDVISLSLGLETIGGFVEKIINKNSTLPIIKKKKFTTIQNGQTSIFFHIVQGESKKVKECRSLGKFTLSGLPSLPAGKMQIQVTFQIDSSGILIVKAKEKSTGISYSIKIESLH